MHNTDYLIRRALLGLTDAHPDFPGNLKLELYSEPGRSVAVVQRAGTAESRVTAEAVLAAFRAESAPLHEDAPPEGTPDAHLLVHKDAAGPGQNSLIPGVLIDAGSLAELLSFVDSVASEPDPADPGVGAFYARELAKSWRARARRILERSALVEAGGLEALWRKAAGQGDAS